ncbi:dethiobiotin synthetase [Anopheles sinensis]|uniref:Dethiobiotin synthetase n=1 Tax=Anopheles sinensis TaxID=74873 RepID=A0A084W7U9_ANOSI|nr:dethiobiotin synthetase [Anopheles sinensis]
MEYWVDRLGRCKDERADIARVVADWGGDDGTPAGRRRKYDATYRSRLMGLAIRFAHMCNDVERNPFETNRHIKQEGACGAIVASIDGTY